MNEDDTTDTTSGSDIESAVQAQAKQEAAESAVASSQPVKRVEEGIQSSDEEGAEETASAS